MAIGFGAIAALAVSQNNLFAGIPLSALTALLAIQTGKGELLLESKRTSFIILLFVLKLIDFTSTYSKIRF